MSATSIKRFAGLVATDNSIADDSPANSTR